MIQRARETEAKCFDEAQSANADILLGEVEKNFLEIGGSTTVRADWKTAVEATFKAMDRLFDGGADQFDGLPTGFKYLDEKIMRLQYILPTINGQAGILHLENWTPESTDIVFEASE